MDRPNLDNAHVRRGRRDAPDAAAADAERLLEDPAFKRAYNAVRDGLVAEIEGFKATGSEADEAYLLEVCRSLRVLKALRRAIGAADHRQALREAGFRSGVKDDG